MTRMRQRIAQRLKDSQNTYAMLTTFNEVDMRLVSLFSSFLRYSSQHFISMAHKCTIVLKS